MNNRNRAEGWKWAKLTGHKNEKNIAEELNSNPEAFSLFCKKLLHKDHLTGKASIGGLNEKNVDSILNDKTKSKTDMKININNYPNSLNVSIKKSKGGQVYLIKPDRFIRGFEKHFNDIPAKVKKGILLFWGEHENINEYIDKYGEKEKDYIKDYEERKERLVAESLKRYDMDIAESILNWFKKNIKEITLFCFARGLAKHKENWAEYLWYHNLVKDKLEVDMIYNINKLAIDMEDYTDEIDYGVRNGGTTIHLPFGFVQWHQNSMQFHHKFKSIQSKCQSLN